MSSNVASNAKIAPDAAAAPAVIAVPGDTSGRRGLAPWAIGAIVLLVLPFVFSSGASVTMMSLMGFAG